MQMINKIFITSAYYTIQRNKHLGRERGQPALTEKDGKNKHPVGRGLYFRRVPLSITHNRRKASTTQGRWESWR